MLRLLTPGRTRSRPRIGRAGCPARIRSLRAGITLVVALAVTLIGCGQAPSSAVPSGPGQGPGSIGTATASSSAGLGAGSRGAIPASTADFEAFERDLVTDVATRSGLVTSLGAARWDAFEAFLRTTVADGVARKGLVGGSRLLASIAAAPRLTAAGGGGAIGVILAFSMMDPVISGKLGAGSSTTFNDTMERVDGQERSVAQITGGITVSRSGSRVVADVDIGMQIDVFDVTSGAKLRSHSFRSSGRIEVDFCPDANGKISGSGSLSVSGNGGSGTITSTGSAQITGTVGEDAYLQSVDVESDASDELAPAAGGTARGTAVSSSGSIAMGPRGSTTGMRVSRDVGRLQRDTANADQATLNQLVNRQGMLMAMVIHALSTAAQAQWRGGACVEIRSSEQSRDVRKNELVQFTAMLFHKIDGVELHKNIVPTFTGKASLDPVDIEVPAPVLLSFKAGSQKDDTGTIHLKSTSSRGIAELDVAFRVKEGWFIDETFPGGHIQGLKCGDPPGDWIMDGTYDQSGMHGVQRWTITIDASGSKGTYTYTDNAQGRLGGSPALVTLEGKAGGNVTLTIDGDGKAVMRLIETFHTYQSWIDPRFKGSDQNAPLIDRTVTWQVGGAC